MNKCDVGVAELKTPSYDPPSPGRRRTMRAIKSKDTKPELVVRRLLHSLGYRFRLHRRDLPGKPDITIPRHKIVLFVNGCFWHQHADVNCNNSKRPVKNLAYWNAKLDRTIERDKESFRKLIELGWSPRVIWECQTNDDAKLRAVLARILSKDN
jgi:DNA mismatch endonuclease (patch repair protein)